MPILVRGEVKRTLLRMALPMLAGTFAMNAYNLTDTWFVARMGKLPLAAMGFTFPVVMLLTCMAGGLGTGITTLVSHAIGRGDRGEAARLVTRGLALTLSFATAFSCAGYLSIGPVFRRLGADENTLALVRQYMSTWYAGALFMALPMTANGVLISMGDSKAASRFMILGTVLNTILDPIMIFGLLGFPAMGMRGAALATVTAQAVSTMWLFHLLYAKHRLLVFGNWSLVEWLATFRKIAAFGIPGVMSMILMPVSAAVITRIVSGFGNEAVAGSGAAGRIEMFAFVIPMALGISLTPFVSQNFGAGRPDRICEARTASTRFALIYGGTVSAAFIIGAPWLAAVFTDDAKVAETMIAHIRIISVGYGLMEVHRYSGFFLVGMQRPAAAMLLNAVRVVVVLIPLSCLGAHVLGVRGVFLGRLITDVLVGSISMVWVSRICKSISTR